MAGLPRQKTCEDLTPNPVVTVGSRCKYIGAFLTDYLCSLDLPDGSKVMSVYTVQSHDSAYECFELKVRRDTRGYTYSVLVPKPLLHPTHQDELHVLLRNAASHFVEQVNEREGVTTLWEHLSAPN